MNITTGIDLVLDARITTLMHDPVFVDSLLQPSEQLIREKIASIFALKEATIKAFELPPNSWLDIEIRYLPSGKTEVLLANSIKPPSLISLSSSVSHQHGMTIGCVVAILDESQTHDESAGVC